MEEIKISVLLDNNLIQADGLSRFTFIPSGRPYVMYTLNEKSIQDGVPLNKVYVSEEGDKTTQFQPINQDEWVNLKNIMATLGEANATIPNNIQLSQLNPTQYIVGPYKKIAINDDVMANILTNQINNQPKEEQIARPTGTTQFFDPSLNVSAVEEETPQETQVPNAFGMTAPVPEESAPISLVQEETPVAAPAVETPVAVAQPVQDIQPAIVQTIEPAIAPVAQEIQQTIEQPVQAVEMPQPIEMPVQAVEMPQPVQQVVETTITSAAPVDDMTIVKQALQTVLNYCNGDMGKLTQLLNEQGLNIIVQDMSVQQNAEPIQTATPVAAAQPVVAQEEFPEPVTSVMDINNIPVVAQEAPAEENVLSEESFEPTTPTLPVDNMEAQTIVNSLPDGVIPGGLPEVAQTVQEPVQEVAPAVTQVVQPVAQEATPIQAVQEVVPAQTAIETQLQPVADIPVESNIVQFPVENTVQDNTIAPVPVAAPMDNIVPVVADNLEPVQDVAPVVTQVVEPVQPVAPVAPAAPVAEIEAVQPVTPVATTEVVQPVAPVAATEPVQPPAPVAEIAVPDSVQPVQFVQPVAETQIVAPAQTMPQAPVAVEAVQNTEVNIAVPQDISPVQNIQPMDNGMGMPAITPLTQEDIAPIQTIDMSQPAEVAADPGIDTSTFLDAGPVIVPIGQEDTASQGLPGDSGAKVLERVA